MATPTRFDPIIQAVTRRAEDIYTKMGIRRDESEDLGRRKKGDADAEVTSIPWEDTTEVSIIALRGFLEDLLGVGHAAPVASPPSLPTSRSAYTPAARAAHAYQVTGHVVHDRNVEEPAPVLAPPPPDDTEVRLGSDFGEAEREAMYGYIRDMSALEQRGVTVLILRRSLTFLESIHQAIADAKG